METVLALIALSIALALLLVLVSAEDFGLPRSAKRRARDLFFSKLDASQRHSWNFCRRFDVVAASGRRYTIGWYRAFNVHCGDEAFCICVEGRIPIYDKLLAQLLLLEADERLFLLIANRRASHAA